MERDKISELIIKAVKAKESNNLKKEKDIITLFQSAILNSKELFIEASEIDVQNNNGEKIDFEVVQKIFDRYLNMEAVINLNNVLLMENNLLLSKVYSPYGIILVSFEGSFYQMLELMLLGILTHNVLVLSTNTYQVGTNKFLEKIGNEALKEFGYNEMFYYTYDIPLDKLLENFKTFDKFIVVGNNEKQNQYVAISKMAVTPSGVGHYDLYIEEMVDENLITKILNSSKNITLYLHEKLNISYENTISVHDVKEAVTQINYNGSGYSAAIFTNDTDNASYFLKYVNSKNVMVNTSPTFEQKLDLLQEDLLKEKNIIMPNVYQFDGETLNIDLKN